MSIQALPDDLLSEIFSYLPVKDIVCCKGVSKAFKEQADEELGKKVPANLPYYSKAELLEKIRQVASRCPNLDITVHMLSDNPISPVAHLKTRLFFNKPDLCRRDAFQVILKSFGDIAIPDSSIASLNYSTDQYKLEISSTIGEESPLTLDYLAVDAIGVLKTAVAEHIKPIEEPQGNLKKIGIPLIIGGAISVLYCYIRNKPH